MKRLSNEGADRKHPRQRLRSFDEVEDATRRTRLANERTCLAWWRSGLAALTVSLGVGKVVPTVASVSPPWPWTLLGTLFGALALVFVVYAFVRYYEVENAIRQGNFRPPNDRLLMLVAIVGVFVCVVTIGVVLFEL